MTASGLSICDPRFMPTFASALGRVAGAESGFGRLGVPLAPSSTAF
eukprot:CAMPEP_0167801204 /NCGR_PEP_ID=MMETSP0111_2-20121227/18260_1 /TAXON_ID=91324 /ORGANISM="Lotharella globosa, Strain CCCM811" /LENGTH=45 /DNA_ID= /DNA_START= /DNA_END= /DNA_ORIENTATION=